MALAVSMDTAHALLKPIWIPWDVVIEKDVADLEVNTLTGSLGGDENLYSALTELLFRVQPCTGFVARAGFHPTMNKTNTESPELQTSDKIVQSVFELCKDQQP